MVEFAIIAPVFVLLIVGIIQFGVALNFWLDMQRIANQGARWAVVNEYPMTGGGTCLRTTNPPGSCAETLQESLANDEIAEGLSPCVDIDLPEGPGVGKPVTVTLREVDFDLVPILGFGVDLSADATMRQEWAATQYTDADLDEDGNPC
jgi:hypothetical protein